MDKTENNKKLDARLEKRKKWLKDVKKVSRLTRARVAQQNGTASLDKFVANKNTQKHKETKLAAENKGTKTQQVKSKNMQKQSAKTKMKANIKTKPPAKVPAKTKETKVQSPEKNNNTSDSQAQSSQEKVKPKKTKIVYVDPVEKLVNSTSVHIPKRFVVVVKNLPPDITRDQVDEHFRKTGGVKSIRIPRVRGTDNAKGYAYIEFNSTISHRIALRLHNTTLAGRKIQVEFTPNDKKTDKKTDNKNTDNSTAASSTDLMSKLNMPFDT